MQNAFRAGAMGPDMGMLPGCNPLISDVAHYVKSSDLVRNMIKLANNEVERAFSLGWASHILADVLIHPLINRGSGELIKGDYDHGISYEEDPVTHIRIELGLDATYASKWPLNHRLSYSRVFNHKTLQFVTRAFNQTYGANVFHNYDLLRAHLRSCDLSAFAIRFIQGFGESLKPSHPRLWRTPIKLIQRLSTMFAPRSIFYALTHPIPPTNQLREDVQLAMDILPERFANVIRDRFSGFANYNLDLGIEETLQPYLLRQNTLNKLAKLTDRDVEDKL